MDRDTAVDEIAGRLGNRTDLDTKIINTMDYVQQFILEHLPVLPWYLVTENLYIDTTADEPKLQTPTGFLREVEEGALWRDTEATESTDAPWVELIKRPHDSLRAELGHDIDWKGAPTHYAILGTYFILAPVPDAVYRIYTRCYQADTLPSAFAGGSSTNEWLTYDAELFIAESALRLSRRLQYPTSKVSVLQNDRDDARRLYLISQESRVHANVHYRMGIARGN